MNKNIVIKNYIQLLTNKEKSQEILLSLIGKILLKQEEIAVFIKENKTKINHIRDWIDSVIENSEEWKTPRVLTIDALNNVANKYFEKKNNKIKTIELDETQEKIIIDLGDYYIVQMLTSEALDNESKIMQHCIGHGGYDKNLKNEEYQYLSLRDKYNKAHVTLEIFKNSVLQIQGKQNKIPEFKYLNILTKWLNEKKYHFDLSQYGLIFNQNDNNVYSIYNLPENCQINSNLSFRYLKIEKLPDNLTVNGNLDLYKTDIKDIPKKLTVNGNLNLEKTKIRELSDDLVVKNNLFLGFSEIEKLPVNLVVGESLFLSETLIKEIPYGIKFNKNLVLYKSKIEKLSDNLVIEQDLIADNSIFKELPKGLFIKNDLSLNGCLVKEIPDDIKIGNNLYLKNSEVEKLPDNFVIKGSLDLNLCKKIKKLPNNLTVYKNLSLAYTEIREIPNDIKIMGSLDLSFSDIKKLPDNFVVNENLYLEEAKIKKLPNVLIVGGDLSLSGTEIDKLPEKLIVQGNLELMNMHNLEEINGDIDIGNLLNISSSFIKKINGNIKCKEIFILRKQIDIINENLDFEEINVGIKKYSKEDFFKKRTNNYFNML